MNTGYGVLILVSMLCCGLNHRKVILFHSILGSLQFYHPPGLVSRLPVSGVKFRGL